MHYMPSAVVERGGRLSKVGEFLELGSFEPGVRQLGVKLQSGSRGPQHPLL